MTVLAAKLDEKRLDWLEMHGVEIGISLDPRGSRVLQWHRGTAYGDTFRGVIDRAIQQMVILDDLDDNPQAGPELTP